VTSIHPADGFDEHALLAQRVAVMPRHAFVWRRRGDRTSASEERSGCHTVQRRSAAPAVLKVSCPNPRCR
jgi:hypothetical protein